MAPVHKHWGAAAEAGGAGRGLAGDPSQRKLLVEVMPEAAAAAAAAARHIAGEVLAAAAAPGCCGDRTRLVHCCCCVNLLLCLISLQQACDAHGGHAAACDLIIEGLLVGVALQSSYPAHQRLHARQPAAPAGHQTRPRPPPAAPESGLGAASSRLSWSLGCGVPQDLRPARGHGPPGPLSAC